MGTHGDFWVRSKRGTMRWIGSVAYDGYPDKAGVPKKLLRETDLREYQWRVKDHLANLDHASTPKDGWPHPWETSDISDYAYVFDCRDSVVYVVATKGILMTLAEYRAASEQYGRGCAEADFEAIATRITNGRKRVRFPKMSRDKAAPLGSKRSGVMLLTLSTEAQQ